MKNMRTIVVAFVCLIALIVTVSASSGVKEATLTYRDIKVTLNGERLVLSDANGNPVEPFIIDGTTYLPLRAIANALGLNVGWDGTTNTVILTEKEPEYMVYITKTGKKYHHDGTCNGGTYWLVPYETAIGFGLTPCDKCVN